MSEGKNHREKGLEGTLRGLLIQGCSTPSLQARSSPRCCIICPPPQLFREPQGLCARLGMQSGTMP